MVSQHALQVVSQLALQVSRGRGGIPACLAGLQAHTQGGSRGVWPGGVSRPTPGGELERSGLGWGLQAHTGGVSRPTPRGVSRPTPGVSQHALRQTPLQQTATAAGGTHPTEMNSCFY